MTEQSFIPFNVPYATGTEPDFIKTAFEQNKMHGDGLFTRQCQQYFIDYTASDSAFMTGSCSLAMDMAAIVLNLGVGDEVLIPDFTFVSTAQAIALRGATPVFCDVRKDTLNLDETKLQEALTPKTKAVMPVHYAGVSAEMDAICNFASQNELFIIEDAAQAIGSKYKQRPVGAFGDMAAFSFHATKNVHCGEGGMLLINNSTFTEKACLTWEKGTDRHKFIEGNVQKYQWKTLGSSFLPSEITSAMLHAQLSHVDAVNSKRLAIWNKYQNSFSGIAEKKGVQLPQVPSHIFHNGHIYFLVLPDTGCRKRFIDYMSSKSIQVVFHYTPLHESDGGKRYGKIGMELTHASTLPNRLARLPIYPSLSDDSQERVIEAVLEFLDML